MKIMQHFFFTVLTLIGTFYFASGQTNEYEKALSRFTGDKKYDIEKPGSMNGITAPDFQGTTIEGKHISLLELKGKVVVLNFWYIACLPCRIEVKPLNELVRQFKDEKDVIFLSVATNGEKDLKAHLDSIEFLFQTIADPKAAVSDSVFHLFGYPTTIVIDRTGKIRYYTLGGKIKEADVRKELQEYLVPVIRKCLENRTKERI